jgi:hypothetical protein
MDTATAQQFEECWPDAAVIGDIKEEVAEALDEMQLIEKYGSFFSLLFLLLNAKLVTSAFPSLPVPVGFLPCSNGKIPQKLYVFVPVAVLALAPNPKLP